MSNIIAVAGEFISFLSKPIGIAFKKALETFVGKTVEYQMDKYLKSFSQEKEPAHFSEKLSIENRQVIVEKMDSRYEDKSDIYRDKIVVIFYNCSSDPRFNDLFFKEMSGYPDIVCDSHLISSYARDSDYLYKLGIYPIIEVEVSDKTDIECKIRTRNIIPGISDTGVLSLRYRVPNFLKEKEVESKIIEEICTLVKILKNISLFCCKTINSNFSRLQLEAELLYEKGYTDIRFIEKNDGYILDLNVMGEQYVFFLPYGYPLVQPQIWVYKGRDSYEITFAKHCWKKEYTISEIISSIERGYNEQTY